MSKTIHIIQIVRDIKFSGLAKIVAQNKYVKSESITFGPDAKDIEQFENEGVEVYVRRSDFVNKIKKGDYDVIFFHSLPVIYYKYINLIPSDKIVIWYSYGFDIYGDKYEHGLFGLPAFIELDLYKEQTRCILKKRKIISQRLQELFKRIYIYPQWRQHKEVLKRIDYFQPARPLDFRLMQGVDGFRAKEIFLCNYSRSIKGKEFIQHKADGTIILGNSASPLINHLDVWNEIKRMIPTERSVIMPLSYGNLKYGAKIKLILKEASHHIQFLDTFMPRDEYFQMMNESSYAIFGSMRQHAMGNIYNALSNDVKVFLYRDSVMFDYLREMGFVICAIEDIDDNSFNSPITVEEHNQNVAAFEKEYTYCYNQGQKMLEEIEQKVLGRCME